MNRAPLCFPKAPGLSAVTKPSTKGSVCFGAIGTKLIDGEGVSAMKPFTISKEQIVARMWELASMSPEETKGTLDGQIEACKSLHEMGYAPAIPRLSEIANVDTSRTGGRQTDQKAAARFLKEIVGSMKPDTSGIQ